MGCTGNRKEEVVDVQQKWDYINLNDFKSRSCWTPVAYIYFFIGMLITLAGIVADVFTAVNLLIFDRWSSKIQPFIKFEISKWIFAGCIIFSFVWMGFQLILGIRAVRSRSVSRGYLNLVAQRWLSVGRGGWKRFMVFAELTKSKHGSDYVLLFAYFSFKGWAETLFADGPRQVLNGMTLYSVIKAKLVPGVDHTGFSGLIENLKLLANESTIQIVILSTMAFTCILWIFAVLQLIISVILWILFLWHTVPAEHSLGSYCQEKIDRRLKGIVAKNHKKMIVEEHNERRKMEKDGKESELKKPTLPVFDDNASTFSTDTTPSAPGMQRTDTINSFGSQVPLTRPPINTRASTQNTMASNASTASNYDDNLSLLPRQPTLPNFDRRPSPAPQRQPYNLRTNTDGSLNLNQAPVQPFDYTADHTLSPDPITPLRAMTPNAYDAPRGPKPLRGPDRSVSPLPYPQNSGMGMDLRSQSPAIRDPYNRMQTPLSRMNSNPNGQQPSRMNTPFDPSSQPLPPSRMNTPFDQPSLSRAPTFNTTQFNTNTIPPRLDSPFAELPAVAAVKEPEVFEMDGGLVTPTGGFAFELDNNDDHVVPAKEHTFEMDDGHVEVPRTRTPPTARSYTAPIANSATGASAYVRPQYQALPAPSSPPKPVVSRARTMDEEMGLPSDAYTAPQHDVYQNSPQHDVYNNTPQRDVYNNTSQHDLYEQSYNSQQSLYQTQQPSFEELPRNLTGPGPTGRMKPQFTRDGYPSASRPAPKQQQTSYFGENARLPRAGTAPPVQNYDGGYGGQGGGQQPWVGNGPGVRRDRSMQQQQGQPGGWDNVRRPGTAGPQQHYGDGRGGY